MVSAKTYRFSTGDVAILVQGDLDQDASADLRGMIAKEARSRPTGKLMVDLAGVTSIDSTGAGALVLGYILCVEHRVEMVTCNPSICVRRALGPTGIGKLLGIQQPAY